MSGTYGATKAVSLGVRKEKLHGTTLDGLSPDQQLLSERMLMHTLQCERIINSQNPPKAQVFAYK